MENRRSFVIMWMSMTVFGWLLGWSSLLVVSALFGIRMNYMLATFATSLLISLMQWTMVVKNVVTQRQAIYASLASAFLCTAAQYAVWKLSDQALYLNLLDEYGNDYAWLLDGWLQKFFVASVLLGTSFGLPQWWLLSNRGSKAAWWIADNVVGMFTALLFIAANIKLVGETSWVWSLFCSYFCFMPAVFALITGLTLHSMLARKPKPKHDDARIADEYTSTDG